MDVGDDRERWRRAVIAFIALVASSSGQETRTMSAPASSSARICAIVPRDVGGDVLVMVCTVIGASPPTGTLPTMIWRDLRRVNVAISANAHCFVL